MKKIFIIISSVLLFIKAEAQINYTINTNISNISINSTVAVDSIVYSFVKITDYFTLSDTGKPALPLKYIRFYLPDGEDVDNISITASTSSTYYLNSKILPVQKPMPTGTTTDEPIFTNPDSTVYNSNVAFPTEMVKVIHSDFFNGNNRIVTIAVTPVQYYPLLNKLDFFSSLSVTITLKQSSSGSVYTVKHPTPYARKMYADILKQMVVNPQDIPLTDTSNSTVLKSALTMTLPSYEYVIITDATLESGFDDFINWKKRKGINIGVVTFDDIINCADYSSGDILTNPPINDVAGKVRQYLFDAHSNGNPSTTWVLIAGDNDTQVPIRSLGGYTTDYYFTDLTNNWNDLPLIVSDVFVGRLFCSSTTEIKQWVTKVLNYEQNPGNGNSSYVTNAFSIEADHMQHAYQAEDVADYLGEFNHTIWHETAAYDSYYNSNGYISPSYSVMGTPKGAEVIDELNTNHYGLISLFCHGGSGTGGAYGCSDGHSNIGTMNSGNNDSNANGWSINAEEAHPYCSPYCMPETGNGLDNLTNSDYQSIIYSISCRLIPFNVTSQIGNNGAMNFGEAFTKMPQTGGVAFLGNTDEGFVSYSFLLYESFANEVTSNDFHSHLGVAEGCSRFDYGNHTLAYRHNLIGCPETQMWTDEPTIFDVSTSPSYLTINTDNTVTVTISNLPYNTEATVCIYNGDDIFMTDYPTGDINNEATSTFSYVHPTNNNLLNITATSHNFIPFQGTIPVGSCDVTLSDITYTANATVTGCTITADDILIDNSATLILHANQYTLINGPFEVGTGTQLVIY